MPTPHTEHPSSGSAEIPSFDADYIPSELDITALSDHQIKGEALEHLRKIISETIIPSSWTRAPHKMGSPSHGSLKAAEWDLLYKVYIPCLMLSQKMSLDAHQSAKTQRKMGQSQHLENELTKNTFHLISAMNISPSWTVSIDHATAFAEHWKEFCLSNQQLFPKQKSKPNQNLADHIPELFQRWGPAQALATWGYERLIGVFSKMPTNNKIYDIDKTLLQHICQCSNLSIPLRSPSVPYEIKQLFKSQAPSLFNHNKYNQPSRHYQQNYDCLVEYLQNFHATREIVDWISLDTTVQSTSHPTSRIVSPWYFPVSNINIGNNIF
ncbi:hypothetical protein O181_124161 [Austropuccinia psidii MF-1]|uniref:Uncharacterized protein n=1 Tax=Austropuccinia psidii MF-1 TaxID=1389203 RepID=A0A9Q3KPW7_9BASI|nr:hypothetical protein [Austropuccinia psidii MF-1]